MKAWPGSVNVPRHLSASTVYIAFCFSPICNLTRVFMLCRYREIDMLCQYLICTCGAASPVQLDVSGARRTIGGVGVTGCSVRSNRESKVKDCFVVEIPDQANCAAMSAASDIEDHIQFLIYLKGSARLGGLCCGGLNAAHLRIVNILLTRIGRSGR